MRERGATIYCLVRDIEREREILALSHRALRGYRVERITNMDPTSNKLQAPPSFPIELIGTILSYCDSKTIASFLMTAGASHSQRSKFVDVLAVLTKERFISYSEYLERTPNFMPCLMSPFVKEYATGMDIQCPSDTNTLEAVEFLSSRLCVLDYFEQAVTKCRQQQPCHFGPHEWMVWCGTISLTRKKNENDLDTHHQNMMSRWVDVVITSPNWYPGLISKWERGMQQCHSFGSDISRGHATGGQHESRPPTHLVRIAGVCPHDSNLLSTFNKYKRRGDFVNPMDQNVMNDLILKKLFIASPHDVYMMGERLMSMRFGNVRAAINGIWPRKTGCDELFGFWTDMCMTDRIRSHEDFTNDVLRLQQKRAHLVNGRTFNKKRKKCESFWE